MPKGYIKPGAVRPEWDDDFILLRRGPRRGEAIDTSHRAQMMAYAEAIGIRATYPEATVHWELSRRRLLDGVHYDFQCLAGHHRVLTTRLLWVPVQDLEVGDELVAFDEHGPWRCWRTATVLSNEAIEKPCAVVRLSDWTEIVVSMDHPWLAHWNDSKRDSSKAAPFSWVETRNLRVGQLIPKVFSPWCADHSWEGGYIAGMLDGEGSLSQTANTRKDGWICQMQISQRQNEALAATVGILRDFAVPTAIYRHPSSNGTVRTVRFIGGAGRVMGALGRFRPRRLLPQFDFRQLGRMNKTESVTVESVDDVGMETVYALGTSTATYFAEGYGMHNSSMGGGRLELGGAVADFKFYDRPLIIRVMGEYWHQPFSAQGMGVSDEEQRLYLESLGWVVKDFWESEILDAERREEWLRRNIDTPIMAYAP